MPSLEDLTEREKENRADIKGLTAIVGQNTAEIKRSSEKHDEAIVQIKEAVTSIKSLDDKMSKVLSVQDQINTMNDRCTKIETDARVLKHDFDLDHGIVANIPLMLADIGVLKKWKDRIDTTTGIIKDGTHWFWKAATFLGPIIMYFVLQYFGQGGSVTISGD